MYHLTLLPNKRGMLSNIDLVLTTIFVISILIAVLNYSSYFSQLQFQNSKNTQTLSILMQESSYLYNYAAVQETSTPYSTQNFVQVGVLSQDFINDKDALARSRAQLLGLKTLSYELTAPSPISSNQFCVRRQMLLQDFSPQPLWVCGQS
ncbi:MAG: hypothetical protein WC492_00075 [Candidatus Micrarchaeia archaeon]